MDNLKFEEHFQRFGFTQRRYPNEPLIQFLAKHYFSIPRERKRKEIKILELGCGSGANLWMIAKEGFDAYGLDIAPTGIELCKQTMSFWGVTANLSVGNMRKLDFENNFFDVIFDVVSMQHLDIKGHKESQKEVYRCLKGGGRFFSWHLGTGSVSFQKGEGTKIDEFTVDNIISSKETLPLENNGITKFLTPTKAVELLDGAGFEDINIEIITRTYNNRSQLIEHLAVEARKP